MQYSIVFWYVTQKQYFGALWWLKNTHTSHARIKLNKNNNLWKTESQSLDKNKRKRDNFQIIDIKRIQKNYIMCKSPAKGVLFEWSHNMISSGGTKMSELKKLGQITQLFVTNSWNLVACKTGVFCSASDNALLRTNMPSHHPKLIPR